LGKVLGIPEKVRQNSYKKFNSKNAAVNQMIQASFLSNFMRDGYWTIWEKKQLIFNGLNT